MTSPTPRDDLLLGVHDALGALTGPRSEAADVVNASADFLTSKLHAAFDLAQKIRQHVPVAIRPIEVVRLPGERRVGNRFGDIDPGAIIWLRVLVDSFLFEASSVRDALVQVANAVFGLKLPVDQGDLGRAVLRKLQNTSAKSGEHTGLEPWYGEPSARPAWLVLLMLLRDITTHRHVVSLPSRYTMTTLNPEDAPTWPRTVVIRSGADDGQPLDKFLDETESNLAGEVAKSLRALAVLKASTTTSR